jgi:hypothetical protein
MMGVYTMARHIYGNLFCDSSLESFAHDVVSNIICKLSKQGHIKEDTEIPHCDVDDLETIVLDEINNREDDRGRSFQRNRR